MVGFDVLCLCFVALLRCGRLPFASQLGWLGLLRHGADIGQTQLRLSLLRRESRAAVLPSPLVLLGKILPMELGIRSLNIDFSLGYLPPIHSHRNNETCGGLITVQYHHGHIRSFDFAVTIEGET